MEIIKAVLFGIVEGITEWLPVSSTGHMILLDEFIQLNGERGVYQCIFGGDPAWSDFCGCSSVLESVIPVSVEDKRKPFVEMDKMILWGKILLACIPAAIIGILFDSVFEELFYHAVPVAVALIVFGIAFIIIERWNKGRKPKIRTVDDLTVSAVLIIGVFQLLAAVFPGTSRSGATIVGALLIGVSRKAASEFTFFLAVPVMLGASLLKVLKYGFAFSGSELLVLGVGMVTAFFVSIVVIRFLMDYIKKHDFQAFGWYRIALGIVVLIGSMVGLVQV